MTVANDPTAARATLREEAEAVLERHWERFVHEDDIYSECDLCAQPYPCDAHTQATRYLALLKAVEEMRESLVRIVDFTEDDLLSDVGSDDGQQLVGVIKTSALLGLFALDAIDKEAE